MGAPAVEDLILLSIIRPAQWIDGVSRMPVYFETTPHQ